MAATKRPQNKCKSCGYTWYPRGKHISNKCPNCGSADVSTVGSWSAIIIIGVILYAIFWPHQKQKESAAAATPEMVNSKQGDAMSMPPVNAITAEKSEIGMVQPKLQPESSVQPKSEELEESTPSPTSICKDEGNFFSRNNCMWKECEKPEFTDLKECSDKKPKDSGADN
jgi:RNA polymerase subunit RPABC4/transcription elongation factor Spt4